MSTIFGIFNRCNTPVSPEIFQKMHIAMSYWKPDESGSWFGGSLVLGHEMLWNTPESKLEQLPYQEDHLVITMDARLDNREELAQKLDFSVDRSMKQITDSELIIASYRKWGEDCPKYLVGDFSFVIWDERKQHLFCARDHLGIKPFYYYLSEKLFIFVNDLKGIVVHPAIPKGINEVAVTNFLVHSLLIDKSLTFIKEVQKLPPAHSLTVTTRIVHKQCFWRAEEAKKVKLPDAKAYASRLRELLEQAVYDRMRSDYPITSHLSGGLDSSTIAVLAARRLKKTKEKLLAFNWLHEPDGDDDPDYYEWSNSKTIAEIERIDHNYVPLTEKDIYCYMSSHNIAYGDTAGFWYEYPVRLAAQKRNSRMILTGWGGDELCTYHGQSHLVNMMINGSFITLFKELNTRVSKRKKRIKSLLTIVYHDLLLPFVPSKFYCKMPRNKCLEKYSFQFIKRTFLPAINREKKKPSLTMQQKVTIKGQMLAYLNHGHLQGRIESWAASAFSNRLEYSYPLLDKRIVEFILGVPPKFFVHNGIGRYLYRSASKGLLPEKKLWSNEKIEVQRVDRLCSISYSAYLAIIKEELCSKNHNSDFGDFSELQKLLRHPPKDGKMIQLVQELGTIMSIIQCEKRT